MSPPPMEVNCPFPEVAEALKPYITTRQEAHDIRRALQASLPVPAVNVQQQRTSSHVDTTALFGVRKAYWRALDAHRQAQARYDALKDDLERLAHPQVTKPAVSLDSGSFLIESYVPLIRQRERQRKLKVIEKTLGRIIGHGGDASSQSLDKVARRQVGELPAPPATSAFSDRDADFSAEYDLTQLKKAILNTQHEIDQHQQDSTSVDGANGTSIDPQAELEGLQRAHNQLTAWMEKQLALISDVGAAQSTSDGASADGTTNDRASYDMAEVESLYKLYLGARQRLLEVVSSPPALNPAENRSPESLRRGSDTGPTEHRTNTSEALLPFIDSLVATKQQEQQLIQHGAYTRRQLASAEAQQEALLSRLADESHLLQPDLTRASPHGKDWNEAATKAGAATTETATKRLQAGLAAADRAASTLATMKDMPNRFDMLLIREESR